MAHPSVLDIDPQAQQQAIAAGTLLQRQESLREMIAAKEQQLNNMRQTTESLRKKLSSRGETQGYTELKKRKNELSGLKPVGSEYGQSGPGQVDPLRFSEHDLTNLSGFDDKYLRAGDRSRDMGFKIGMHSTIRKTNDGQYVDSDMYPSRLITRNSNDLGNEMS